MDISVVSGTYNRLAYVQKMVDSVRKSIGNIYGLRHQIILVDGGSVDGTQAWIGQQPDIHLIQHGSLLGAVKAFNDGAFAAQGQYVILANDDIEFVEDSILKAWLYMQAHPDCGVGCFYQDRNGREWHIENMPVVINGRQANAPYGQVCIVPKWLGDLVGWWGTYLHTYGGDNELSAQIYQLGFKVSPITGAKIHDREAKDELRRINNINGAKDPRAIRGHHPDSWTWGRRWRNEKTGLVGPIIKEGQPPMYPNNIPVKERVLYLPIFEEGWTVQKEQKRGLREALAKVALVIEYDYVSKHREMGKALMLADLMKICHQISPTIVLTQLHNGAMINPSDINILRSSAPGARFINWNGDYWPDNLITEDGLKLARAFDLQTVVNRAVLEEYQAKGINAAYWQIGWEPDGVGYEPDEFHDVVFLGSGYSPARQQFVRRLKGMDGVKLGLYGSGWPEGWSKGQNLYDFKSACKVYRGAKISLGDSQWPETGFVSNRVFQALAAGGAALAHQWFRGMDQLGLLDGETCIIWQTFQELEQKIRYYLAHENERRQIALAGEQLALERHSFEARVKELFQIMNIQLASQEESWR